MDRELDNLSRTIGRLEEQIKTLFKRIDALEETSTREHRVVHDIVEATSDAIRTLTAKVDEMKPLTDDYREKRAERRGAAKLAYTLYAVVGGLIGSVATWVMQYLSGHPPHQ